MSPSERLAPIGRLLCLLNFARPTPADLDACRALLAEVDTDELLALAAENAVVPWTLRNLERCGVPLPSEGPARRIQAEIADRNRRRAAWATRFLGALRDAGIEVILLKGFGFAYALYQDEAYKRMNDVDILVRRADVLRTIQVLRGLGFDNYKELYGKEEISDDSHHTPAYMSPDLDCVVGLHWGLVTPRAPWKPDIEGIWARKVPLVAAGVPAFGMCPEDDVLHLCVHLPFYKLGLRELADVYNRIRYADFSWEALAAHVAKANAGDPVWRVLSLTDALVPLGAPPALLQQWRASAAPATRADTERRLQDPDFLLHSRSVWVGGIEKQYVTFRKTENLAEKGRTWLAMHTMLFWPPEAEAAKVRGRRPPLSLADRLAVPLGLYRAIGRDYGALAVVAMQLHMILALAWCALRWPWTRRGPTFATLPEARLLDLLE